MKTIEAKVSVKRVSAKDAGGTGSTNTYTAVASTAALDRDQEVLLPKGAIYDHFMKNPVMLNIHQMRQLPVGKVTDIKVTDEAVSFSFEFADTPAGNEIKKLYDTGFMNAFSVGFYPKSYIYIDNDTPNLVDAVVADGSVVQVDLTKYASRPYGIIPKWELLEISPVPVPSNPEALIQRSLDVIATKGNFGSAARSVISAKVNTQLQRLTELMQNVIKHATDDKEKELNVVAFEPGLIVDEKGYRWDTLDVLSKLAIACSDDKSGDKDHIDWGEYSKAFALVDLSKADQFTSYKYLHHRIHDDELILSKQGLFLAMVDFLKNLPTLNEGEYYNTEDVGVYGHLSTHLMELGIQSCPELRAYSSEELEEILKNGQLIEHKDPEDEPKDNPENGKGSELDLTAVKVAIESGFKQTNDTLVELEAGLGIKLNIVRSVILELQGNLKDIEKTLESFKLEGTTNDPETDDGKAISETVANQVKGLNDLLKSLEL